METTTKGTLSDHCEHISQDRFIELLPCNQDEQDKVIYLLLQIQINVSVRYVTSTWSSFSELAGTVWSNPLMISACQRHCPDIFFVPWFKGCIPVKLIIKLQQPNNEFESRDDQLLDHCIESVTARLWSLMLMLLLLLQRA